VKVKGGISWRRVIAGGDVTCGLALNGKGYCWGRNAEGGVGDGTGIQRLKPVLLAGGRTFTQVVAGTRSGCGVTTGRLAYCWGWNHFGVLGDGTTTDRLSPVPVLGAWSFEGVSVGGTATCGTQISQLSGVVMCWGTGGQGQLGNGSTSNRYYPGDVSGGQEFDMVSVGLQGSGHVCGVTTGHRAYCWGWNFAGQLGDGTTQIIRSTPVAVVGPA
jgi:alpha-tubulin suppressor-like RCC1 family protein